MSMLRSEGVMFHDFTNIYILSMNKNADYGDKDFIQSGSP